MNLADIKDQLSEKIELMWGKIQENPSFNTLREKYEILPQKTQRLLKSGSLGVFVLMLISILVSFFSTSSEYITEFEENREVTRMLLKTASQEKFVSPKEISFSELESLINRNINNQRLLDDQKAGVSKDQPFKAKYIPKDANQVNASVSLSQLNLKQIINIGYELQNLVDGIKMTGLKISNNAKDDHYYDVKYSLAHFSFPQEPEPVAKKSKKKSKKKNPKRRRRKKSSK
ncbi:MAG: hypothetical protein HOO06_02865 [Bdellovibrionaceae bacterium]|jgi:hypothetical protein|nr:hypothetical protein [Pseudobdellovibrionaceae bacterium]